MNVNWKQKLASRKFWAAIAGVIVAMLAAFNVSDLTVEKVSAVVAAVGVLSVYIYSEGNVDAARLLIETESEDNERIESN